MSKIEKVSGQDMGLDPAYLQLYADSWGSMISAGSHTDSQSKKWQQEPALPMITIVQYGRTATADDDVAVIGCETKATVKAGIDQVEQARKHIVDALKEGDENKLLAAIESVDPCSRLRLDQLWRKQHGKSLSEVLKAGGFPRAHLMLVNNQPSRNIKWFDANLQQIGAISSPQERDAREYALRSSFSSMSKEELDKLKEQTRASTNPPKTLEQVINESRLSNKTKAALLIYEKGAGNITAADRINLVNLALKQDFKLSQADDLRLVQEALRGDSASAIEARKQIAGSKIEQSIRSHFWADDDRQIAIDYLRNGKADTTTVMSTYLHGLTNDKQIDQVLKDMTVKDHVSYRHGEQLELSLKTKSDQLTAEEKSDLQYYRKIKLTTDAALCPQFYSKVLEPITTLLNSDSRALHFEDLAYNGHETALSRTLQGDLGAVYKLSQEEFVALKRDKIAQSHLQQALDLFSTGTRAEKYISVKELMDCKTYAEFQERCRPKLKETMSLPGYDVTARQEPPYHPIELNNFLRDTVTKPLQYIKASDRELYQELSLTRGSEYKNFDDETRKRIDDAVKHLPNGPRQTADDMLNDLKSGRNPRIDTRQQFDIAWLSNESNSTMLQRLVDMKEKQPEQFKRLRSDYDAARQLRFAFGDDAGKAFRFIENGTLSPRDIWEMSHGSHCDYFNSLRAVSPEQRDALLDLRNKALKGDIAAQKKLSDALPSLEPVAERQIALAILGNKDRRPQLADLIREQITLGEKSQSASLVEKFSKLSEKDRAAVTADYKAKYGSEIGGDWISHVDDKQKQTLLHALAKTTNDREDINSAALVNTIKDGSYSTALPTEQSMNLQDLKRTLASSITAAERDQLTKTIANFSKDYVAQYSLNDENKKEYAHKVADKIFDVVGVGGSFGAGLTIKTLVAAVAAGAILRTQIVQGIAGDNNDTLKLSSSGALAGAFQIANIKDVFGAVKTAARNSAAKAFVSEGLTSAESGLLMNSVENAIVHDIGAGREITPQILESAIDQHVHNPQLAKRLSDKIQGGFDKELREQVYKYCEQQVDAGLARQAQQQGVKVTTIGHSLRTYQIGDLKVNLKNDGGWFTRELHESEFHGPVKVRVQADSAEDLGKLQRIVFPALERDPILKEKVVRYKTMDPLLGAGQPGVGGKPKFGQDSKIFTIYVKNPQDLEIVQTRLDQIIANSGGRPQVPLVTGNAETIKGLSGRVSTSRDMYPIEYGVNGNAGAGIAPRLDAEFHRKMNVDLGARFTDNQLRDLEKQAQIMPNTLSYSKDGKLMLQKISEDSGINRSCGRNYFYLDERQSNRQVGKLTDRQAMYALTHWGGGKDADPVWVWDK